MSLPATLTLAMVGVDEGVHFRAIPTTTGLTVLLTVEVRDYFVRIDEDTGEALEVVDEEVVVDMDEDDFVRSDIWPVKVVGMRTRVAIGREVHQQFHFATRQNFDDPDANFAEVGKMIGAFSQAEAERFAEDSLRTAAIRLAH